MASNTNSKKRPFKDIESTDNSTMLNSEPPSKKLKASTSFEVTIKTTTGKEITLNLNGSHTIKEMKAIIEEKEGYPPSRQRLIYRGKLVEDNKTLNDYNLDFNSSSNIIFNLVLKRGEGKDITTSKFNVITLTFLVNGFYKKYTLNSSMNVCHIVQTIYNDCDLSQFGFPWTSWNINIGYSYIPNDSNRIIGNYDISKSLAVRNRLWPVLPERDEDFKQWLNADNNDKMPQSIVYPLCIMNGQYRKMEGDERLISATLWLDIEVAKKLITSNMVNINAKEPGNSSTALNLLSLGHMPSNISYAENENKWLEMIGLFGKHKDIDLETMDDFDRSPLANAVRYDMKKIAKLLIRCGACVDNSVIKEIKEENYGSKQWLWQFLKSMRKDYMEELRAVLSMYHCDNVLTFVLDYFLCPTHI